MNRRYGGLSLPNRRVARSSAGVPDRTGLVAWYSQGIGVTVTGAGVSQWDDQSGNDNHLLQGTDTNRPAYLEHSSTNYLWLPGVAGNYASTPDAAALDILSDVDLRAEIQPDDWTPATQWALVSKWDFNGNQKSYRLDLKTDGTLGFWLSEDGIANTLNQLQSTIATGFTDGTRHWVRVTWENTTDEIKFYTSDDGVSWTQLGDTVAGVATGIADKTALLEIGSSNGGGSGVEGTGGKIYQAQVYNGIDGTLVFDADFTAEAEDTTSFTESSSEGATVTVNQSGGWAAQIVGSTSILFDGSDNYLDALFALSQPNTIYILGRQVTWTGSDVIVDGATDENQVLQHGGSPKLKLWVSSAVADNTDFAVGTYAALSAIFDGAGSLIQVNNNAATTGNPGNVAGVGGITLGARFDIAAYSNIQVKEVIIYNVAHPSFKRNVIISHLLGL